MRRSFIQPTVTQQYNIHQKIPCERTTRVHNPNLDSINYGSISIDNVRQRPDYVRAGVSQCPAYVMWIHRYPTAHLYKGRILLRAACSYSCRLYED